MLTRRVFGFVAGVMFLAGSAAHSLMRGRTASLRPAVIIAVAYLAFGTYALAITGEPLVMATFLLPGLP